MKIGIDIDGVLTDLERTTIDFGTKMCIEENWPITMDLSKYWEVEAFGWTSEQADKFWNKYLVEYVTQSPARRFAKEIISKLREEGNNIYIITARDESGMPPEYYGKMQQLTREWLERYEIEYDKLIFAKDSEKLEKCLENNVDIMIEDSPRNIRNISSKVKVIKFDCQYNKDVIGSNIINAYSWYHIYRIIKENS